MNKLRDLVVFTCQQRRSQYTRSTCQARGVLNGRSTKDEDTARKEERGRVLGVTSRLTSLVREDCVDKRTRELRPDGDEGTGPENTRGWSIAG